jgi:hypothetical protein
MLRFILLLGKCDELFGRYLAAFLDDEVGRTEVFRANALPPWPGVQFVAS